MPSHAANQTRERILDAATRQFAEHGFAATSMRRVTSEAKANLASVHYHFGSKEALILAVFERLVGPVNRDRLERLDAALTASGGAPLTVETIVDAFVAPALRLARDPRLGAALPALLGRIYAEPGDILRPVFEEQFGEVARRFAMALGDALPDLPNADLRWRMHFLVGAMAHTMADRHSLSVICGGIDHSDDPDAVRRRLVAFVSAGLRGPLVPAPEEGAP